MAVADMIVKSMITAARLRELLHYDPETGELTWVSTRGSHFRGRAGNIWKRRSRRVSIEGRLYEEHCVIWAWYYGEWPFYEIDHIDLNALNNRIENLREATHRQNNWNKPYQLGRQRKNGKWTCHIRHPTKGKISLGVFDTREQAVAAYKDAARKIHGVFFNQADRRAAP